MDLHGVFAPLTTPFAADGSLALDRLRSNIARYNATRLAGYLLTGSTGEAVLLSMNEIERVWAGALEAAAPGRILLAGTGAESTAETIERTNRAATLGYHAALVKTPHYYKPALTPDVLAEHFERVADAARIPVLLYSVPNFTGIALETPAVVRLAAHPNIIGIKESSGNIQRVGEIVQGVPPGFQVVVGSAGTFYPSLAVGAIGGVLGLACVLPEMCVELYELARAGERGRALSLQQRLARPAKRIVSEGGVSGVKYAMDACGYFGGLPRRPLLPLTDAQKKEIDAVLAAVKEPSALPAQVAHS